MNGFEDRPTDWAPASRWLNVGTGVQHQMLQFIVPGKPVPKGNVIKGRYGGYHDPTKGLDDWLQRTSAQAKAAMRGEYRRRVNSAQSVLAYYQPELIPRFQSAVMVDVTFVLHRPKSTLIDGKRWDLTKPETPPHTKKPDNDKLLRAVMDAMTGIVYEDDSQAIEQHARKRYGALGETTGAIIMVTSDIRVV